LREQPAKLLRSPVTLVTFADFFDHLARDVRCSLFSSCSFQASLGAHFRRGFEKKSLARRWEKNSVADVAAFHDDAATGARALLLGDEQFADLGTVATCDVPLARLRKCGWLRDVEAVEDTWFFTPERLDGGGMAFSSICFK